MSTNSKGDVEMKKCSIKLINGKWSVIDENGVKWCAFDYAHKSWAEEFAMSKKFMVV